MAIYSPCTLSCWEPWEGLASLDGGSQVVITALNEHVPCQGAMREVTAAVLQFKVVSFTWISWDFIPFACFVSNREAQASKQGKYRASRLLNIHNI